MFYDRLSVLLGSAIPIVNALEELAATAANEQRRVAIARVGRRIARGDLLSDALYAEGLIQSMERGIIGIGEGTGTLVRVLSGLAADARRRQIFREIITRSLYGAAGLFVLAVVLTPLGALFSSGLGAYLGSVAMPLGIFLLIGICAYGIAGFMGRDDAMRLHRDRLLLSLPVLGGTVRLLAWSRFCSALYLAYTAGMDMATAVRYAIGAMGNQALILAHSGLITTVERGGQLSDYFRRHARDVPEPLSQMIITGEVSGTLDSSLHGASRVIEDRLNTRIRNATRLLGGLLSMCALGYAAFRIIMFYVGYFNQISSF